MSKVEYYQTIFRETGDWDIYLRQESCLPGLRANIELAQAVAEEGDRDLICHLLSFNSQRAPANIPEEFLAFCGTLGQGTLLLQGGIAAWQTLRSLAADSRWRIREAVAMALARYGRQDLPGLLEQMGSWSRGNALEKRAAAPVRLRFHAPRPVSR